MKRKSRAVCLLVVAGLLSVGTAAQKPQAGQEREEGKLRVSALRYEVRDDSLRVSFTYSPADSAVASTRKLIFTPLLRAGIREAELAPIVVSGRRRWLADRRSEYVDPTRRPAVEPYAVIPAAALQSGSRRWNYNASVPYARWMKHAELCLEERDMDCCRQRLLAFRILEEDLGLKYDCGETPPDDCAKVIIDTVYVTLLPPVVEETVAADTLKPDEVKLCIGCTVVYITFRQGKYDILPDFDNNRAELRKVDSLIACLPQDRNFLLQVNGYASPEGTLSANEVLARNRTEGFVDYLRKHYRLPRGCTIRSGAVGEDWAGLIKLLQNTGKPYAQEVLRIIRDYGVFDGRERILMELDYGRPYRDMLETLFPYLRRIEMRVSLEEEDE